MGLISGATGCAPLRKTSKKSVSAKVVESSASSDALRTAQESLVLLKNSNNVLPVNTRKLKYIVLTGERDLLELGPAFSIKHATYRDYDNIGAQCGGWTVSWQGYNGNFLWEGSNKRTSGAKSIVESLKAVFSNQIFYNNFTDNTCLLYTSDAADE